MQLLLDSHLLLWAAGSPEQLSKAAFEKLSDEGNELFLVRQVHGKSLLKVAWAG